MAQFPDGAAVRLRSRVLSTYLRADVDRVGISLGPYRGSLNTAWTVRRVVRDGASYAVFRGAAYGRYIALRPDVTGPRIIQSSSDAAEDDVDILWEVIERRDGGDAFVLLRHGAHRAYLVTPGAGIGEGDETRSKHWFVEVITHDTAAFRSPTLPASDPDALLPAVELFPDRAHVRLRNREDGLFMFADEDGVGVSMSPHRATLNTVWAVHLVQRHGTTHILLHSAAYGRYLAYSAEPPPTGPFVQNRYYHEESQMDVLLQAFRAPGEGSPVVLRYEAHGLCSEEWDVELIPLRARPPHLPLPDPSQVEQNLLWRSVLYAEGDDYGNYNQRGWNRTMFGGRSVYELREQIAGELGEDHPDRIVLSVWSGYLGRLTPLVVDLPSNDYTVKLVVYVSWTRAGLGFQHPNVDA